MEEKRKTGYHLQAAQYFENLKDEEGTVNLYDYIEARWHYLRAGEWDKAADITFALERYLTLHGFPHWSMELLQELELDRLNETNQMVTYDRIGILYQGFGEYNKALDFFNKACEIAQKNNDLKNSATALHHVGNIYYFKGNYDDALKQYQKSLEIQEKIGDIKGVSNSFHHVGMVYQDKGDYDEALKQYQKSLEIFEKIGDKFGIASSMGQMGNLHVQKNEFAIALEFFIQAFLVFAKIGSPYANQARKDIAKTRDKLPEDQFHAILKKFNLEPGDFAVEQ